MVMVRRHKANPTSEALEPHHSLNHPLPYKDRIKPGISTAVLTLIYILNQSSATLNNSKGRLLDEIYDELSSSLWEEMENKAEASYENHSSNVLVNLRQSTMTC